LRAAGAALDRLAAPVIARLSTLPDQDEDSFLPPLTPYAILQLGRVKLQPYFRPGDPAIGQAVRGLAGRDIEAARNAIEELEATARLALLTHGQNPRQLSEAQIADLVTTFGIP
jgi:3-dehydro-4-phosphotetronate decarboxylase